MIYFTTRDLVTLSNHRKEKAQWPEFPDTQFAVDWHLRRDLDPGEELVLMFQSDGPPLVGENKRFGILMQSPRKGTGTFRMSVHSLPFGNCTVFVEKRIGGRAGQSQRASNVVRFSSMESFFEH